MVLLITPLGPRISLVIYTPSRPHKVCYLRSLPNRPHLVTMDTNQRLTDTMLMGKDLCNQCRTHTTSTLQQLRTHMIKPME